MGVRKPLVMAVAVGLQTKMWGQDGCTTDSVRGSA
ncbi:uncharacterized protein CCOS01_17089 [Colletotrichum costaricense]|uniref:Uncharacterized protein n=2 Tax=Colletotrichum acutatum species complex TaxID=2707335 RepID=A0AAJ0DRA0_9PEZI|nr:uncharacterized protein CCOS01_17089 [Colletotrichum costaricense]KAK0373209.1 hypothetical protein CLIM01_09422 [Colletotrichum limetticola]KAK1503136.1 hypothetical protein CCOS01_17089 [Colletotrichum costaricense]